MKEIKIKTGTVRIGDTKLIVTEDRHAQLKRAYEYHRTWFYLGVLIAGFLTVGYFGQVGISIARIVSFVQFLGKLVAVSIGIAFLIVILIKRENPLKGLMWVSNAWEIPLQDITKTGVVDGGQKLAIEFDDEGTKKTMIVPFFAEMKEERELLETILGEYVGDANDNGNHSRR